MVDQKDSILLGEKLGDHGDHGVLHHDDVHPCEQQKRIYTEGKKRERLRENKFVQVRRFLIDKRERKQVCKRYLVEYIN
jgi:hypothetical protein